MLTKLLIKKKPIILQSTAGPIEVRVEDRIWIRYQISIEIRNQICDRLRWQLCQRVSLLRCYRIKNSIRSVIQNQLCQNI